MLRNSPQSYGFIAKVFHWLMAAVIIGMFALGLWMHELPLGPDKFYWYGLHKSIGILVLVAVVLRYFWRLISPVPSLPKHTSWHEKLGAHATHLALYALMFAVPLLGWLMSSAAGFPVSVFGWFTLPDLVGTDKEFSKLTKELHELGAFAIIGLATVHASAALYHHFIKKDSILKRMLP